MNWEEAKHLHNARKNQEFRELVEGGLKFLTYGACCLLVTIFLGIFLYAHQNGALGQETLRNLEDKETMHTFALTAIVLLAGIGFVCGGLGLWRCLVNTPDYDNARESMFLCVVCFLIGTLFQAVSIGLGGLSNYLQLHMHVHNWKYAGTLPPATLLQIIGIALYILSFFAFNNHLMILHDGLKNVSRRKFFKIFDMFLIFTSLLVGGFAGAFLSLEFLSQHPEFMVLLLAGSLIDFFWFLFRMQAVRGLLIDAAAVQPEEQQTGNGVTLDNIPQRLSGMRRILRAMDK